MLWSSFLAVPCCRDWSFKAFAGSTTFTFLATSPACQRSEWRWIQAKNSEDLFISGMYGWYSSYFRHVWLVKQLQNSNTHLCKHVLSTQCFVVATSNPHNIVQVSSPCLQQPWRCGVGWDNSWLIFRLWKWQVLVQCKSPHLFGHWRESPRSSGPFFWGQAELRKVMGSFFLVVKLQQVSENATQNIFSSYSQEVELCHVEVLYQCFASPVKIEECFLFREAVRGFPNFRSRLGTIYNLETNCISLWLCVQHITCLQCTCSVVSGQICFELVLWLVYFPGHCQLVLCLIKSNAWISDKDQTKSRIDKQHVTRCCTCKTIPSGPRHDWGSHQAHHDSNHNIRYLTKFKGALESNVEIQRLTRPCFFRWVNLLHLGT